MNKIDYKFRGIGLTKNEKKRAKRRFDKYCKAHNYERLNDLEILESLIFHEIQIDRIKEKIEDISKSKTVKDGDIVPKHMMEQIRDIEDQVLKFREKLGLFEQKKTDTPLKHLNDLEKKFQYWMDNNKASREIVCPFCSKLFFLKIRTDIYEAYKSPFFKDKILMNEPLWKVYKEGKITKEEHANVLGVSPDYIDFLEEKFFHKDSNKS